MQYATPTLIHVYVRLRPFGVLHLHYNSSNPLCSLLSSCQARLHEYNYTYIICTQVHGVLHCVALTSCCEVRCIIIIMCSLYIRVHSGTTPIRQTITKLQERRMGKFKGTMCRTTPCLYIVVMMSLSFHGWKYHA